MDVVPFFLSAAMAAGSSFRSSARTALPATVLESEGMGERGGRGGSTLVAPGMGEQVEGGRPLAAMIAAVAARGELSTGSNRGGHGLALEEDGRVVLTSKGIEPR